ncbi:hypothetical protein AMTRI_Chr11g97680 [Amborella trichopoda]
MNCHQLIGRNLPVVQVVYCSAIYLDREAISLPEKPPACKPLLYPSSSATALVLFLVHWKGLRQAWCIVIVCAILFRKMHPLPYLTTTAKSFPKASRSRFDPLLMIH